MKTKLSQLEILNKIYDQDLKASDCGKGKWFETGLGKIEVWNYIDCQRQTAEDEGNDFEGHIRCALSDEQPEIIKFFHSKGFII